MKNIKLLRILFVFIFLSLLSVALPASPAQAVRGITLSPTVGKVGDRITITGTDFNKSTADIDKYAAVYFSSDEASTIDDIDDEVTHYEIVEEVVWLDEEGDFEATFRVPDILDDGSDEEDVTNGTYYVYVCHYLGTKIQNRIRAVATFTVTMGQISLSPLRGEVGTLLEITGTDFADNEPLTIEYDGYSVPIYSGNKHTSSRGDLTSVILIPDSVAGSHTVTAIVSGDEAEATFTVEPDILINPTSGEIGTTVIISGTGFGKMKAVTIWFHNTAVATVTTNILGSFYTNFNVPDIQAGRYNVDAEEGANIDKTRFTITEPPSPPPQPPPPEPSPSISISSTTGNIGQGLVMGGSGFKADATVTIKYDNELLTATTADSNGVFAAAFTVPVSNHGNHTITASDGTNTSELIFAVESIPPTAPILLIPEMEAEVKSPIYFDWWDVTDPSAPVTYTIQVATSPDFSATSTVLEKKGLTKTEYSVTETEGLRLGAAKTPYYWRARAIDGASNEGNWANPGVFYVAPSGIPTWAIIIIVILGVIFLLALGYFIHMKTSTSR
jgi:hypothetical protein